MLEFEVKSDATVEDVLYGVIEIGGPELKRLIMERTHISGNLIVMLNKRDVNTLGGLGVVVKEDDEIAILPHVQGG